MEAKDLIDLDFVLPLPYRTEGEAKGCDAGVGGCLTVRCRCLSSAALLSLTRVAHPLYGRRCWTGLQVYGGAEVLSRLFLRRPQLLRGRAVMELGCGIGLTAIAALHAMEEGGGKGEEGSAGGCLVVTDGEEDAVALARLNLARRMGTEEEAVRWSGPAPPASLSSPSLPRVSCVRAEWSEGGAAALSSFLRSSSLPGSFPLIYGSDLLYARISLSALLSFAVAFLSSSSTTGGCAGQLLLCHTPRLPDTHRRLRREAEALGLAMAHLPLSCFLTAAEVRERGWANIDLSVLHRAEDWQAVQATYTDARGQTQLQRESQAEQLERAEREEREAQADGPAYEAFAAGLHRLQLEDAVEG